MAAAGCLAAAATRRAASSNAVPRRAPCSLPPRRRHSTRQAAPLADVLAAFTEAVAAQAAPAPLPYPGASTEDTQYELLRLAASFRGEANGACVRGGRPAGGGAWGLPALPVAARLNPLLWLCCQCQAPADMPSAAVCPAEHSARILRPGGYGRHPLQARLAWQLAAVLSSLGAMPQQQAAHDQACMLFAEQLQMAGLGGWALFVLGHVQHEQQRAAAVSDVLGTSSGCV